MAAVDQNVFPAPPTDRVSRARITHFWLVGLVVVVSLASMTFGATGVTLLDYLAGEFGFEAWLGLDKSSADMLRFRETVIWDVRIPRLVMGLLVGASLAVSGVVMQGLFRNPLADPGIVGVSSGAGLGAVAAIVMGGALPVAIHELVGTSLVPVAAFLGAWATTLLLYRVSTRHGRTSVATMLLAGIALGALAGAATGLFTYVADDAQLRDINFWSLGSLLGASWAKLQVAGPIIVVSVVGAAFLGRALNGLALGEATASHIGIRVQRMKNLAILLVAAATGAAVAVSGGIGFIGIVVPHLLRLATGPDHRPLLINAALLGASLLVLSDMISRIVISPAELPIGIITAILGAPFFLWILLRQRSVVDL